MRLELLGSVPVFVTDSLKFGQNLCTPISHLPSGMVTLPFTDVGKVLRSPPRKGLMEGQIIINNKL